MLKEHWVTLVTVASVPIVLSISGCGKGVDCALNGDTIKGRVTFGANITVRSDVNVVVQYSSTSFASDKTNSSNSNSQGLLGVPYSICAAEGTYQHRAFQDLNGNGELD